MKRVMTLEQSAHLIFHAVIVGSLYLLFAGHNQPGGGFVGGLVAGAAITLRYLAGGLDEVRSLSPLKPWSILAGGVVVSTSTAIAPLFAGQPVMSALGTEIDPPLLGHIYMSTTLIFDVGVYLVVVGLVFMVFEAFGDDSDGPEPSAALAPPVDLRPPTTSHVAEAEPIEVVEAVGLIESLVLPGDGAAATPAEHGEGPPV